MLQPLLKKGVTLYLFHKRKISPKRLLQQLRKYNSPDQLSSPMLFDCLPIGCFTTKYCFSCVFHSYRLSLDSGLFRLTVYFYAQRPNLCHAMKRNPCPRYPLKQYLAGYCYKDTPSASRSSFFLISFISTRNSSYSLPGVRTLKSAVP